MARQFFVSLVVASILMVGCAENNPVSINDENSGGDGGFTITALAKTSATVTDTTDSIPKMSTVVFVATASSAALLDSVEIAKWYFGDGSSSICSEDSMICSASHRYITKGTFTVELLVTLKGGTTRNAWKKVFVVDDSVVVNVVNDSLRQDSLFKVLASAKVGHDSASVTLGIGVNALVYWATKAGVTVSPYYEGPIWNGNKAAITRKTADGKFWIIDLIQPAGQVYTIRGGINLGNNRYLRWEEIKGNRFADSATQIFKYSIKYNAQVVPGAITDFGTPTDPIDTGNVVNSVDLDTSKTNWIVRGRADISRRVYVFEFNMNQNANPVGQVGQQPFVVTNIDTANGGRVNMTSMKGDSIGVWELPFSQWPTGNNGLILFQYGRGTSYRNFQGSPSADPDKSYRIQIFLSQAILSKRAAG